MNVRNFSKPITPQERLAWIRLMGTQPIPADRDEMTSQAKATWEKRSAQCASDIDALGILVEAAETLNVFNGAIDTTTSTLFGPKPKILPKDFNNVEAIKLGQFLPSKRENAGNDE